MRIKTKILLVIISVFLPLAIAAPQEVKESPKVIDQKVTAPAIQDVKAVGEVVESTERIVKGAAFSAEAITESIQILADGNRITRRTTSKMYRDSEGRFRREESVQLGGNVGSMVEVPPTVLIIDPTINSKYFLYPASKTFRSVPLAKAADNPKKPIKIDTAKIRQEVTKAVTKEAGKNVGKVDIVERIIGKSIDAANKEIGKEIGKRIEERIEKNTKKEESSESKTETNSIKVEEITENGKTVKKGETGTKSFQKVKAKNESLGGQIIEGVEAEGTRSTKTIEIGEIGNERPIKIVYEKWYSKDLQMIVMSKHFDPRFGENNYRLINIKRTEPDISLFTLPSDYRIITPRFPGSDNPKPPKFDVNSPRISKPRTDSAKPNPPKLPAVEKKTSP